MSDPNDKLLDDYLRRDSIVSERYRELDANEVPRSLDDAVLAQARVAVTPRKASRPAWVKWGAPIALAASAVMAVAIVLEVGVEEPVRLRAPRAEVSMRVEPTPEQRVVQEVIREAPKELSEQAFANAAPPAAPAPAAQAEKPKREAAARSARTESQARRAAPKSTEQEAIEIVTVRAQRRRAVAEEAPMPIEVMSEPSPDNLGSTPIEVDSRLAVTEQPEQKTAQALADEAAETVVTGSRFGDTQSRRASVPISASASQPAVPAPTAALQAPRLEPEVWLDKIRTMRREGKVLEADEQWKEFSETYPQFEVAETDFARPTR